MAEQTVKVVKILKNIFPNKEEGLLLSVLNDNFVHYTKIEELVSKCVEQVIEGEEAAERRLKNAADNRQGPPEVCLSDASNTESLVDVSQSPKSSSSFGLSKLSIDNWDGERHKLEDGGKREQMNEWLNTCEKKEQKGESGGEEDCEGKSDTSTEKQYYLDPDDCSDSDFEVISLESTADMSPNLEVSLSDSKQEPSDPQSKDKSLSKELPQRETFVPCSGSVIEVCDSDTATLRASLDTNDCLSDSSRDKEETGSDHGMNTQGTSSEGADTSDDVIHISDTPLKGDNDCDDGDVINITDTPLKDTGRDSDFTDSASPEDVNVIQGTKVSCVKGKSLIDVSDIVKLESPTRQVPSLHIILSPGAIASQSHDHLDLNHSGDVSCSVTENKSDSSLQSNKTVSFIDSPGNLKNKVAIHVRKQNVLPNVPKKDLLPHKIVYLQSVQKQSRNISKSVSLLSCKSVLLKEGTSSDSEGSAATSDTTPSSVFHDTRPVQSLDVSTSVIDEVNSVKPLSKGILKKRKHVRIDKNQVNEQLRRLREKSSNSFQHLFAYNDDMKDITKKKKLHVTDSGRSLCVTDKAKLDKLTKSSQLEATRKWIQTLHNVPSPALHDRDIFLTSGQSGLTSRSADRHGKSLLNAAVDTRGTSRHGPRPTVPVASTPLPDVESDLQQIVAVFPDVERSWARTQLQKLKIERPLDFLNHMCSLMADTGYEKQDTEELSTFGKGKGKHKSVNVKGSIDKIKTSQRFVDVLSAIGEEAYEIRRQGRKRPSEDSMDVSDVPKKVSVMEEEVDYLPDIPDLNQNQKSKKEIQPLVPKPQDCILRMQCEGCSVLTETDSLSQCSEGHVLCRSCVEKCVKQVLAQDSKITIICLVGECKTEIRLVDAKKVLPEFVVDLLQERIDKQERSSISKMSGIVSCPDCGMSVQMGIYDKQFHCPNTDCMLACCRYCKRPWNEGTHNYCSPLLSVPTLEDATIAPSHWDPSSSVSTEDFMKVVVAPESMEFEVIQDLFRRSMREYSITTLTRIQNPKLWQKYALTRSHILEETGVAKLNEKHLFHGTKPEVVESICREGFDWRLCGQHGTAYGQGSYFATDALYSHKYSSAHSGFQFNPNRPHPHPFEFQHQGVPIWYSQKFPSHPHTTQNVSQHSNLLLVARVVCGRYTRGNHGMRRPPVDPDDPKQRPFNSVVNNPVHPNIFVTFDISQTYPEYVVEYSHKVFTG